MREEAQIELISGRCMECPRLELETVIYMGKKHHRCKNLQLCREVLGFWKMGKRFTELTLELHEPDEGFLPLFGDKEDNK